MSQPEITRPHFPAGYVNHPKALLPWSYVEQRLTDAKDYWVCSVSPDGRPHAIPTWGVFVDGKVYFDCSPQTRHARNIVNNPRVVVHLESGDQAVIVEGLAQEAGQPAPELGRKLAAAYAAKYAALGYTPAPDSWDRGGLYAVMPCKVLAWTNFLEDPTRFTF